MSHKFQALVLEQPEDGQPTAILQQMSTDSLMDGDVLVRIQYSDLNYKDGLAILGKNKVVCSYPMIPGIDFVGTVEESASPMWNPGDDVILTGWGVGEKYYGGYSELARVKGEWLVPLPHGMSPKQAMSFGTAGLTAMLCVLALEDQGMDEDKPVLVTGAAGGVGSVATFLLGVRGHRVHASTGRLTEAEYLQRLGANQVIPRLPSSQRPLGSEKWAGVIDTVGGETLAAALTETAYGGAVAACGLAGGTSLPTTVFPFILRGVRLIGIDSVQCPLEVRISAWNQLAQIAVDHSGKLEMMTREIALTEIETYAKAILEGQVRGRTVVKIH